MAGSVDIRYAANLDSNVPEVAAASAQALEAMREALYQDSAELRSMQAALKQMSKHGEVGSATINQLKTRIEVQTKTLAKANENYIKLGGNFRRLKATAPNMKPMTDEMGKLGDKVQLITGPRLGGLISKLGGLKSASGAAVLGIGALAAAFVAVTAAIGAAVLAMAKFAAVSANARRDESLRLEALGKMRYGYLGLATAMRRPADSADFLQAQIDSVSGNLAIGRDQIEGYVGQLTRMGLRGGNLQAALEGMALTAQVNGESQAQMFAQMAVGGARAGVSIRKLADDAKARLGGIAERQMFSLEVQSKKLKSAFAAIFSGVKIEGFLKGLRAVTAMFGQNEATGRALKKLIEVMFDPILGSVETVGPVVKRFIQGMTVGVLLLAIGVLNLRNKFKQTFGDVKLFNGLRMGNVALLLGVGLVGSFAAALLLVGGITLAVNAGFLTMVAVITAVSKVARGFWGQIIDGANYLRTVDWSELGLNLVRGIVRGIQQGALEVVNAVTDIVKSAEKAFMKAADSHSPSRLFAKRGLTLPQGAAKGVDQGRPLVDSAVSGLVNPEKMPTSGGNAKGGSAAGRATVNLTVQNLTIGAPQGSSPQAFAQQFVAALANELEAAQLMLGIKGATA